MGDLVNLKLARKRKLRAEQDQRAAANRARYGRTKEERKLTEAEQQMAERTLDGHKRED